MEIATTLGPSRAPKVGVLGEPNMRWYLLGQLTSLSGTTLQSSVLALLILKLAGNNSAAYWVGMVSALNLLPGIFLGPFAGILLDRVSKKKVLIVTGILGAIQSLALAYLTHINQITIFEINVLTLLMGIVNAVDGPGRNVIVKDAVFYEHNAGPASKWFTALYNLATFVGPGSAGYLILRMGYSVTFVLNSLSFMALVVALMRMRLSPKPASTKHETWKLLMDGAKYTFGDPGIALCVVISMVFCTFVFSYYSILAVISRDMFKGNLIGYSVLAGSSGLGALLGSFAVIVFDKLVSHKTFVIGGTVLLGVVLFILSHTTDFHFAVALIFLGGFNFLVVFSTLRSSIVHLSKPGMAGVVMGFAFSFFFGGMMLGSFGAGYVADRWGCPTELKICGVALLILGSVIPFLPGINKLDSAAQ
jgi:predicted MFS family arabinose efflux permease